MIDIHCHILPGIDDGASNLEESIAMAKVACNEGITTIVATPHHHTSRYTNRKNDILGYVDRLNEELKKEAITVTILPGQETRVYGEIVADYHIGEILTYANLGKYVLLEFPSNHVPRYTNQLFYEIQSAGLTPIIAHPERNSELIESPDKLYELISRGALSQITAASLTGDFGKKIKKFTEDLIDNNLTHFIASDAHDTVQRPFRMREGYAQIERTFGRQMAYLFQENAELLIDGSFISVEPPTKVKRKKLLGIF